MKLVLGNAMTDAEARHAIPSDEAVGLFQRSLENHTPIDGLAELRRNVGNSLDFDAFERLKAGEWQLVDKAAYRVDWGNHEARVRRNSWQMGDTLPVEMPKIITGLAISIIASYRKHPLKQRKCSHGLQTSPEVGQSRASGIVECHHVAHTDAMSVEVHD